MIHTYTDNRDIQRIDPNQCDIGSLYKPWYFIKLEHNTSCPNDINKICLLYNKYQARLRTMDVACTSYRSDPRHGEDLVNHAQAHLAEAMRTYGQINPIICTEHYDEPSTFLPGLIEDPGLTKRHCFEGHHRLITAETFLDREIDAEVCQLLDMDLPINYKNEYNQLFNDRFWSSFQQSHHRVPWFEWQSFIEPSRESKYLSLKKSFDFIKENKLYRGPGIDIGCGEGLFTQLASTELDIPMLGIDLEMGRIVRALIARHYNNRSDTTFTCTNWNNIDQFLAGKEFAMLLSVLHHMPDPVAFMKKIWRHIKTAIVEVRVRDTYTPENNHPTIVGYQTIDYFETLFKALGNYHYVQSIGDRRFYVLWKPY